MGTRDKNDRAPEQRLRVSPKLWVAKRERSFSRRYLDRSPGRCRKREHATRAKASSG